MEDIIVIFNEIYKSINSFIGFQIIVKFISIWYWVFLPFVFLPFAIKAWFWWRRESWEKKQEYTFLELIPSEEIVQPFNSMEQVFSTIWSTYSSTQGFRNLGKKYWRGRVPYSFCIEMMSNGPNSHILIRCLKEHKKSIETTLYAYYADLEIREVEDYTKSVPYNIPNKEWDMYGFDEILIKPDVYPIKTYEQFFEKKPENIKQEKRIDPLNAFLEGMAMLEEGEQFWIQARISPVTSKDSDYMKRAKAIVDKLTNRGEKTVQSEEGGFIPPEMKLTAREREIVNAIQTKIGKLAFLTNIRGIYLAKREIFDKGKSALGEQFFSGFNTQDLNAFKKLRRTKTKSYFYHIFTKHFIYLKKRQIFRRYLLREKTLFPLESGPFILNTEELATMFHLPIKVGTVGTNLPRVEAKKGEAPTKLPTGGGSDRKQQEESPRNLPIE